MAFNRTMKVLELEHDHEVAQIFDTFNRTMKVLELRKGKSVAGMDANFQSHHEGVGTPC